MRHNPAWEEKVKSADKARKIRQKEIRHKDNKMMIRQKSGGIKWFKKSNILN